MLILRGALIVVMVLAVLVLPAGPSYGQDKPEADAWIPLFNGKDLDGWYTFLNSDGKNNDPNRIFQVHDSVIHIYKDSPAGEDAPTGYFATEANYSHYRLRFEYKWVGKRFKPRANTKRDSGLIYHLVGRDMVWPIGVELQVQEGDTGDVFAVYTTVGSFLDPNQSEPTFLDAGRGGVYHDLVNNGIQRVVKDGTYEKDGWNVCEAVVMGGDYAVHVVNGKVNNRCFNMRRIDPNDPNRLIPLTAGKILFQAEFAEVMYRNIEIQPMPTGPFKVLL